MQATNKQPLSQTLLLLSLPSTMAKFFILLTLSCFFMAAMAQNRPQDYVAAHNAARAQVGVGELQWNYTVASYAQKYAVASAAGCTFEHSNGPYGENLGMGWGDEFTGIAAVKMWVSEQKNYDHGSNKCEGGECLHYTQVVWRDTTSIGCARAPCGNCQFFITCNYYPPGNYIGESPY